jgi:hypothetical protein
MYNILRVFHAVILRRTTAPSVDSGYRFAGDPNLLPLTTPLGLRILLSKC